MRLTKSKVFEKTLLEKIGLPAAGMEVLIGIAKRLSLVINSSSY